MSMPGNTSSRVSEAWTEFTAGRANGAELSNAEVEPRGGETAYGAWTAGKRRAPDSDAVDFADEGAALQFRREARHAEKQSQRDDYQHTRR